MTADGNTDLRQVLRDVLQDVPPSPAPLDAIIRQSKGIRLRRAGAAVGVLGLAAIVAVTTLALAGGHRQASPATVPVGPAIPGGVFARGTADGHPWQLAVQDIADPGYRCLPAIVLNGTDADPVYPDSGGPSGAAVALGPAVPGIGFGFIQLPAQSSGIVIDGSEHVQAVNVAVCGYRYHVVGFSYLLTKVLRITMARTTPGLPVVVTLPMVTTQAPASFTDPQTAGMWIDASFVRRETASATLASGSLPGGQGWIIKVQFGAGADCYEFDAPSSLGSAQMGSCGPVSTPSGPETIMALPIGFPYPDPSHSATGATGYALQVSPGTAALRAVLSDGSTELATLRVVDGRKYAAFIVPDLLRLTKLTWLDARGLPIASTTALPLYGYLQFQP
jgi:hypothetical protein